MTDEAGLPEEALASLRAAPRWAQRVALAPPSVREWEALVAVRPAVERYRNVSVPALLLAGTETAEHPSFATRALESTLPNTRTARLDDQGHTAHLLAPELLAGKVLKFLPK